MRLATRQGYLRLHITVLEIEREGNHRVAPLVDADRQLLNLLAVQKQLAGTNGLVIEAVGLGIFVNGGTGKFTFRPLPRLAQAAPIFAMVFSDLERDGDLALCAVGNSFSPQAETGHMDGGVGLILRNTGGGFFEAISPSESGLVIPGDAKSLNLIDLNRDGRPDLVAGINNGEVMAFLRSGRPQ